MFTEEQLEKYADVLLWALQASRREKLRNGAVVLLRYDLAGLPLAEVLFRRLVEHHFNPVQRLNASSPMQRDFYLSSAVKQLTFRIPGEKELCEALDGSIHVLAPDSLTHLSAADPERIGMATAARKYLRDILDERERQGVYGWTLCLYPTPELARSAGATPEEYAAQVVRACRLNTADPVREWKLAHKEIQEIRRWLAGLAPLELRVESAHTDLRLAPGERRRWLGLTGHNIPSFEVYLSPDWRGTEGVYYADLPSYRSGNLVEKTMLEFRRGKVVRAEAETGGRFLAEQLSLDEGASRVGEFSLTDRRFSGIGRFMAMTLYDENYGGEFGNCHLALGASYAATYDGAPEEFTAEVREKLGFNQSALHWDLVNTEPKTVTAKLAGGRSKIIYENGEFAL
ncbi:MAG: aminopeptidase [Thermodesulfobacteriota bacterium]